MSQAAQFGQISSFGRRLGGFVLDGLIYGLIGLLFAIPGIAIMIAAAASADDCVGSNCDADAAAVGGIFAGLGVMLIGYFLVFVLYVWQLTKSGQTFGRKIVGVRVIDEATGQPPGWGKAIGRSLFAAFISGQIVYIGYLWMLWDDKKQTLHDKVTSTHVIDA